MLRFHRTYSYLSDPAYRRKISRQLNKGESLHALKRDLLFAHEGTIRVRHLEQQTEQAWCLTVVTNAVITWTTRYLDAAVAQAAGAAGRRARARRPGRGRDPPAPAQHANLNCLGRYSFRASQPGEGLRPLRDPATADTAEDDGGEE